MLKRATGLAGTAIGLLVFAIGAAAQSPARDTADANWIEARLIDIDLSTRTITVQFDENNAIRSFKVAKDAEIVRTDGLMEIPVAMSEMHAGTELDLEFSGLEGETTLRKIMNKTAPDSNESSDRSGSDVG